MSRPLTTHTGETYVEPEELIFLNPASIDDVFSLEATHGRRFSLQNPALLKPGKEDGQWHLTLLFRWACESQYAHNLN